MYNDLEKDTFGFEPNNESNSFDYNGLSGLGESNYENEDLFNVEVENNMEEEKTSETQSTSKDELGYDVEIPLGYETSSLFQYNNPLNSSYLDDTLQENNNSEDASTPIMEDENSDLGIGKFSFEEPVVDTLPSEEVKAEENSVPTETVKLVDTEFLDSNNSFSNNFVEPDYELPVVSPSVVQSLVVPQTNMFSETPIEELNKLTEYKEEKVQTTDIKSLFDRVGVNVKEASDIFKKNTEMKEKIDSRFEELKKLQAEVERSKKSQYDEINSYKEEVLGKLTEKKEEIEKRLNKLKDFQTSLEKEKGEFEKFRKTEKEEIERVQKEVQEAYDSRREELNHIEDVLRKQKDALDEERSQLSLDRIQYESDKNELANNLLKFNEIVDSFTSGMDKINKE